jgi:hypothetical protein
VLFPSAARMAVSKCAGRGMLLADAVDSLAGGRAGGASLLGLARAASFQGRKFIHCDGLTTLNTQTAQRGRT